MVRQNDLGVPGAGAAVTDWDLMFKTVQAVTRSATAVKAGLEQTAAAARGRPDDYGRVSFWSQVTGPAAELPIDEVVGWAARGLARFTPEGDWDLLVLDLGDCPEIFRLYPLECQPLARVRGGGGERWSRVSATGR